MFDVNIIIVNYKMKDQIEACLASLFRDLAGDTLKVKVVVVDNNSQDGIKEFLQHKYPAVQCIELNENAGFGKAQNAGIKSAEAKYHFALNPDTVFSEGQQTLGRMYEWMEAHLKVGIMGPKLLNFDGSLQYSCYRFPSFWQPVFSRTKLGREGRGKKLQDYFLMKDFDHTKTQPVDWVMGSAMLVRQKAIEAVGLFDERFWMYAEDSDWCRRMWEAGRPVYYVADIVIRHAHGRGSAKVPGIIKALLKNKLARVHLISWLKYMWKWRGNRRYYAHRMFR